MGKSIAPIRQVLTRNHIKVHEGKFFTGGHLFTDVTDDASVMIRITVGADEIHGDPFVITEGKAYGSLERGTTFSAAGTSVGFVNNNCESSNTPLTVLRHTPTVDAAGSALMTDLLINGGTGPQSVGAEAKSQEERILKANTEYLLTITNKAGATKDLFVGFAGYEE